MRHIEVGGGQEMGAVVRGECLAGGARVERHIEVLAPASRRRLERDDDVGDAQRHSLLPYQSAGLSRGRELAERPEGGIIGAVSL